MKAKLKKCAPAVKTGLKFLALFPPVMALSYLLLFHVILPLRDRCFGG